MAVIIGSAAVQIRAVDKYFEKDVRAAVKKIKNLEVTLNADLNMAKVNKKLADLRYRLKHLQTYKIQIDANTDNAHKKIDKVIAKGEKELQFNAKANTQGATTDLEKLKARFAVNHVPITAQANTTAASAQLAWLARNRHVNISAGLDPRTKQALVGAFNALTGTLDMNAIKNAIVGILANFEGLVVKSTSVVAAIGAISAAALTLGANLFSIADDMTRVVGLAAALPAVFAGGAAMIAASTIAWKGFGKALNETDPEKYAEALAKLAPEAQEAVKGLKGVGGEIAKPVREAFWESMATSLQDTVQRVLPQFKRGMTETGGLMGTFTRNWVEGFGEITRDNRLITMFKGINGGIEGLNAGVKPFTRAITTLGVEGSKYLPDFGKWIGDLGVKFDNFIQKSAKAGDIGRWIEEGTQALQDMGSIVVSTTDIFKGLAEASHMSGGASLSDFAGGMRNIANVVNGEPFKSRLVTILEGARRGSDALGEGIGELAEFFGEASASVGIFLDLTGQLAGGALSSIVTMFRGTGLGSGLIDALNGAKAALADMEPTFRNFGTMFGDLGTIAGELLINMAPGLNQLSATMSGIIANLQQGVLDAMPVFNQFIQGLLAMTSGPLQALASGIGNLLSLFAQLPDPLQALIMGLGLVALAGPKVVGAFLAIQKKTIETGRIGVVSMAKLRASIVQVGAAAAGARASLAGLQGAAAAGGLRGLGAAAKDAGKGLGASAGAGMRGALGGAAALLGGPWGIAIGGAIGAIGAFGEIQAKAKQGVDDLTESLDKQSAAATAQTKTTIADRLMDVDTSGWDDFIRGHMRGAKSMEETNAVLNESFQQVTNRLADPTGRAEYAAAWEKISLTMLQGGTVSDELAAKVGETSASLQAAGAGSVSFYGEKIRNIATDMEQAEAKTRALAEATGTSSIVAAQLSANYETLASVTSSASEKFSALKQNMDLLNDGARSAKDANKAYEQTIDDTSAKIDELSQKNNLSKFFNKATGEIKLGSQAGRDLDTALQGSADSILNVGVQAFDAARKNNKTMEESQAAALEAMEKPVQKFRQQLESLDVPAGTIDKIISNMGLDDKDIMLAISADGNQAMVEAARVQLAMDAFANGEYEAVLGALPQDAMAKVAEALGKGEEWANGNYEAVLTALDDTPGGRASALAGLLTVADGDYVAYLESIDQVTPKIDDINGKPLLDKKATIEAEDQGVKNALDVWNSTSLADKHGKITAEDNVTTVLDRLNNAPMADKNMKVTTTDLATQVLNDVIAKQFPDKANLLKTTDLSSRVIEHVNRMTLNGKSNTLTTKDLVSAVITQINNTVLRDKSMTITTHAVTAYSTRGNAPGSQGGTKFVNANGNIFWGNGSVQQFKDGGINAALMKYMSGSKTGSERRVAQIARGSNNYRVWGERETHGEAYIPLGAHKRVRSLKILDMVAKKFGMGLVKSYANGGITGGSSSTSSRSGSGGVSVSSNLLAMIEHALMARSGNLYTIGKNIVSGVMTGVNMSSAEAGDTMTNFGGLLEDEFKKRLEIHSPSKTFRKLGRWIVKGLDIGIKTTAKDAVKQIRDLTTRISDEAAKSQDNLKKLQAKVKSGKATSGTYSEIALENRRLSYMKALTTELKKQDDYSKKFGKEFKKKADYKVAEWMANIAQKSGKVNQATLKDYARAIEVTTERIKKAQDKLKDQIDKRNQDASAISNNLIGEFNLGSLVESADSDGYRPPTTIKDIKSFATGLKNKLLKFEGLLKKLKKAGVSATLINEVALLGSEEGTVVAEALLTGSKEDISSINSAFKGVNTVSERIGMTTSNNMHLAGINATKGFIEGLLADQKALEKAADKLAQTIIDRTNKKLQVRSPSRVFHKIGGFVGQGFAKGINDQQANISRSIDNMVNPDPRGFSGKISVDTVRAGGATTATGTGNRATAAPINVTVNPAAGMDEELVGQAAARELLFRVQNS